MINPNTVPFALIGKSNEDILAEQKKDEQIIGEVMQVLFSHNLTIGKALELLASCREEVRIFSSSRLLSQ